MSDRTYRLPRNVTGLTTRDGRKLNADKNGLVRVPERYARDADAAMHDTGLLSDQSSLRSKAAGKDCGGCGMVLYTWQQLCPRCGENQPNEAA